MNFGSAARSPAVVTYQRKRKGDYDTQRYLNSGHYSSDKQEESSSNAAPPSPNDSTSPTDTAAETVAANGATEESS